MSTLGRLWMKLAHILGIISQYLILGLVYFVVMGLYNLLWLPFRFLKQQPQTQWQTSPQPQSLEELKQPF